MHRTASLADLSFVFAKDRDRYYFGVDDLFRNRAAEALPNQRRFRILGRFVKRY